MDRVTLLRLGHDRSDGGTARESSAWDEAAIGESVQARILPVSLGDPDRACATFVTSWDHAIALHDDGVDGIRITVLHDAARADVLDGVVRSGAAFLRTTPERLAEAVDLAGLPACEVRVSVVAHDIDQAVEAVRAGARDVVVSDWNDSQVAALRDAILPEVLVERTALPLGTPIEAVRDRLAMPLFTCWLQQVDCRGAARPRHPWAPGRDMHPPVPAHRMSSEWPDAGWMDAGQATDLDQVAPDLAGILERSLTGTPPTVAEMVRMFEARGAEVDVIAHVADQLRQRTNGEQVTYVVNRNINYTNQCYFRCGFCGFSRGPKSYNARETPYRMDLDEVVTRSQEAWDRGATEVCLVGGIHPDFTGDFYASVLESIKGALPAMHVHAFTPLEVWQGAHTLGVPVRDYLERLKASGLGSLPGTAAEILDDDVREHLCPDKIRTAEWAEVMISAHESGIRATSTIMCGHIDGPVSWANHYEVLRQIQRRTGGFTEFIPLPFVHMASPIFLQGRSRPGPTWDEVVLIHAVARIAFDGLIPNIQASWVKLGLDGGANLLHAGCNDMGGTLMNESISRSSGASHGEEVTADELEAAIRAHGRVPARRNTIYDIIEAPV
ncbi:MAG: 5-amino-6-(D-ribitylamino)uracil--L-tyrosine 4-hydroxyphenyl transferase CofH [Acidobacteria bacterium]|nr:5-amino-6-(D-ribitylamino)uracil--L-tyrosine 4-hydroxyphenyl transferase CofH [Acidobacteriota bacterium]